MLRSIAFTFLVLCTITRAASAQGVCTAPGQRPSTAFPVCGTQIFEQHSVPICGVSNIPGPSCNTPGDGPHQDKNPFWYKFTCYTSGTLGFTITPLVLQEDYDWQLFDITGKNPEDIYTDRSMYVCMNWSGVFGITGASSAGTMLDVCGGQRQPLFSAMPNLQQGHEYLLLISHFSNSQSGYKLEFGGGTADITDPVLPAMNEIKYDCASYTIGIKLSRKVLCASLATDGSDFLLNTNAASIVKAAGVTCASGFDLDSVVLYLDKPLPAGTYTVTAQNGSDGQTVYNACGKQLAAGDNISFNIAPIPAPRMPLLKALPCAPDQLVLDFPDDIRCATIATNGSDFTINGPSSVRIISAAATCNPAGLTRTVTLQLDQRMLQDGNYAVDVISNTITSTCHIPLPAGGSIAFNIPPQPPVLLRGIAAPGCTPNQIKVGMSQPVRCTSIAADGSDFILTGPRNVRVSGAWGNCNSNGMADSVTLQLSEAIPVAGAYTVIMTAGTDGNTLQGACWQLAATAQTSTFNTADTVNASFSMALQFNCKRTTAQLSHSGGNAVNNWLWTLDGEQLHTQNVLKVFSEFGTKQLQLEVTNGVCKARKDTSITITSELEAAFDVEEGPYCPMETITPVNKSTGANITSYEWDYGNGSNSYGLQPLSLRYFPQQKEQQFRIRLMVQNDKQCRDTADHYILAVSSCYVDVPTAFTPNGDGQNDYFYPLNAYKALDLRFLVFNRYGGLMFETHDWRNRWDGRVKNSPADAGTYIWMLEYTEKDSGKKVFRKGTVVLLR